LTEIRLYAATAALDQPGGEDAAYGKAKADWQPRIAAVAIDRSLL
jgi:hypothetical protein